MFSMISEMARDGFLGFVMACLMIVIGLILAVLLYMLGYSLVNNVNMPIQTGEAVIIGKEIIPEHTTVVMQTMTIGSTTTLIPITTHYDIQYMLSSCKKAMKQAQSI